MLLVGGAFYHWHSLELFMHGDYNKSRVTFSEFYNHLIVSTDNTPYVYPRLYPSWFTTATFGQCLFLWDLLRHRSPVVKDYCNTWNKQDILFLYVSYASDKNNSPVATPADGSPGSCPVFRVAQPNLYATSALGAWAGVAVLCAMAWPEEGREGDLRKALGAKYIINS